MPHKYLEIATMAHRNISHDPERRGASYCADLDQHIATITPLGGDPAKLEALFVAWMYAKGRCASPMITGPANFNTRRNEKAWDGERRHSEAYFAYISRVQTQHRRKAAPPKLTPQQELDRLKRAREEMRAHYKAGGEPKAFAGNYMPANLNAKIKRAEANLAASTRAAEQAAAGPTRYQCDEGRVWFTFEGKPDEATRDLLKSRAFKWTPSKGHWGRQLTPAALQAAQFIASKIGA